jgi:uncharacterized membrane protein
MSPLDDAPGDSARSSTDALASDGRLAALEARVVRLSEEVTELREALAASPRLDHPSRSRSDAGAEGGSAPSARETFLRGVRASIPVSGDELESLVGRYGTLALAALVILMMVGALIKMAVERGLLTPEVRVAFGIVIAVLLAAGGLFFRRRGDVRYGGVLLALALAVVDLVSWGAGPRFHLIPTGAALAAVDLVALGVAAIALHDGSEFLFVVSVAGALSAPFVTSDRAGSAVVLLSYGAVVLAGALRAARNPRWMLAFTVLVAGAVAYALSAAALPIGRAWYGAYAVTMFAGVCAAAALVLGETEWRSELPRAYLAVALIGVTVGWDAASARPLAVTMAVALGLASITYAALLVRGVSARLWRPSAVILPFISVAVAFAGSRSGDVQGAEFALWAAFALIAWSIERRAEQNRAGAHLLSAAMLGGLAVTAWFWGTPLLFVAGLAGWAVVVAALAGWEVSLLPVAGVGVLLGSAALSSIDQLASRSAYSYVPFTSRSSASALCAAIGIALVGEALARGAGAAARYAARPVRLGALIGFLIVWGRMELAQAFNPDLASFLLTSYYAACGVGSIVAGRRFGIGKLRVAGLMLAILAAFKAVIEVTDIRSILLRVGAYAAVGMFLLGAGYLYREQRSSGRRVGEVAG